MAPVTRSGEVASLVGVVPTWARARTDVQAVALVVSWARETPRSDSDVDLVIVTREPSLYLESDDWATDFGVARFLKTVAWGEITERRGVTASGLEIEFGITSPRWANTDPVDAGTSRAVTEGFRTLYDPDGVLSRLTDRVLERWAPKTRTYEPDEIRRRLGSRCFICEMIAGNPDFRHHVVFRDDRAIAFLSKYPQVYGYVLVAPISHLEQVTGDLSEDQYVELQRIVYRVGEALRKVIPTERLYILSLGSQSGNAHVHWHVVPLPPGIPFEDQQYALLSRDQILDLDDDETAALVARIRRALA